MSEGVSNAVELITKAFSYLFTENQIAQLWLALVVIIIIGVFIFNKLTNRD